MRITRQSLWVVVACDAVLLAACGGSSSSLNPAGQSAEHISTIFWALCGVGVLILIAIVGLGAYAARCRAVATEAANRLVLRGTVVITIILGILVAAGVSALPAIITPESPGPVRIVVTGERWWWRVRYEAPNLPPFEIANEVRLPVGQATGFVLRSSNVIHSFWIPSLGGKMDLIPGRENSLVLRPTRTGIFRGVCAEFCGKGHATMTLQAVVVSPEEFQAWLRQHSQ